MSKIYKRKALVLHIFLVEIHKEQEVHVSIYKEPDQTAVQERNQTFIGPNSVFEHQAVTRAIDRFEPEFLFINLHEKQHRKSFQFHLYSQSNKVKKTAWNFCIFTSNVNIFSL